LTSLLFTGKNKIDPNKDPASLHPLICTTFFFAYVWSLGGNLITKSMEDFDSFIRDLFSDTHDVKVMIMCCSVKNFWVVANWSGLNHNKNINLLKK